MVFVYLSLFFFLLLLLYLLKSREFYRQLSSSYEITAKEMNLNFTTNFFYIPKLSGEYNGETLLVELKSIPSFFLPNNLEITYGKFFFIDEGVNISKDKILKIIALLEKEEYDEIRKKQN